MAEYVRFRLTAARVGASMALLALVAGVADKARAATDNPRAHGAAQFLKLAGLTKTIAYDFNKLDKKLVKLTNSVASLDAEFIKFNRNLTQNYYKAQSVNKIFLKTADANAKFIPASAAGGFVHGKANVVSGALSSIGQSPGTLLSVQGGIIAVLSTQTPGLGTVFTIHNGTSGAGIALVHGQDVAIKPNGDTNLPAVQSSAEIQVQIFPSAGFNSVTSILIGLTPNPSTNQPQAVAQAFTGGV